jgi:regulation of enolase protein 1 (concanavalin A-like superfamily)
MKSRLFTLALAILALPGFAEQLEFDEDFKLELSEGWSWIREHPGAWRVSATGLEIRVEPGNMWGGQNNAKNVLVRPLPALGEDELEIRMRLEHLPTEQYEQVDLVWYLNDSHMVKIGKEMVDGKVSLVMGREEGDKTRTIAIVPIDPQDKSLEVKFRLTGEKIKGSFRPQGFQDWKLAGECELPRLAGAKPQVSIQCYQGPADKEHWARLSAIQICRYGKTP